MLFMTYRPGRVSHLASQVRLFPPGPSWVWERAGEAPGRDVARGPRAEHVEGVCGPRPPMRRPPFHGQPSLWVRAAPPDPSKSLLSWLGSPVLQPRHMSQASASLHRGHL